MEDKKEFDVLFKTYYSRLYCYAFHIINDLEASKDITSDAFEYLWLHFSEIKATTAKSYLYAYAHSKSIDYLRKLCIHKADGCVIQIPGGPRRPKRSRRSRRPSIIIYLRI